MKMKTYEQSTKLNLNKQYQNPSAENTIRESDAKIKKTTWNQAPSRPQGGGVL